MKNLLLMITLLATFNVGADIITIGQSTDTTLNTTFLDVGNSHWDTTTGLEWLDFGSLVEGPMTFGHSLNSAEADYGVDNGGWRLARYDEVYALFDMFFPTFTDNSENGNGTMLIDDTGGTGTNQLIPARNSWLFAFGTDAEVTEGGTITLGKSELYSTGLFLDENDEVSILGLKVDTNPLLTTLYGPNFDGPSLTLGSAYSNMGVFMVRDYTVVPIPAAMWLMVSGILGLLFIGTRKLH